MALEEIHTWNLVGLIGAFIDLFVAYVLLCVSTIAFLAFNLYRFFGLHLPCPCKGILGFKNSNLCFHMMLFEWPLKKVCSIQVMAAKRFPFDLVWVKKDHSLNYANENKMVDVNDNRVVELEDESSCSGPPRLLSLVDKESGYDAKGKRVMSLKQRSGIRRRKRGGYDCGKIDSVICCDDFQSDVVAFTSCSQSINVASGKEVSVHYDEDDRTFHDLDEKTCHSYEFNASMVDSPVRGIYSSSMEHYMSTTVQDNIQIVKNEDDRMKMLENALEEERSAYAALYLELEKERAAAASAADEAMAMISRLQEEKASMEMEMRQFERLIEERAAYDEEEMNIMQEILIRREKENLFLEKELESYRGQRPPLSFETYDDPPQIESTILNVKKDGEEPEEKTEHKGRVCDDLHSSFYDTESDVLDVHVIDDNVECKEKEIENLSSSLCSTFSDIPTNTHVEFGSYPCASKIENINNVDGLNRQLSMLYNSKCKSLPLDCESDSSCSVHNVEKLRIDNEIEVLGERLRIVKHEKEKLTLFAEKGENEKGQLKLLEEIANRIQQIKQLRNPARGVSLPPSSAKVNDRKRRCQSATWETCESY